MDTDNYPKRLLHKLTRDLKLPKLTYQVKRRAVSLGVGNLTPNDTKLSQSEVVVFICKGLVGGPDRDRTDDLFHAMEARSQLRHRPTL